MGFGLLFIGCFFSLIGLISIVRVAGFAVVIFASKKLKQYNSSFSLLGIAGVVMTIISLASAAADLVSWTIGEGYIGTGFVSVLGHIESIASSLFALVLLWAIKNIATDTDERKIRVAAVRNAAFVIIYLGVYAVSILPFGFAKYFSMPALIIWLVWVILTLVLVFSCYAGICDESDVDMARKPSRFAFINELRAKNDEREREKEERRAERVRQRRK